MGEPLNKPSRVVSVSPRLFSVVRGGLPRMPNVIRLGLLQIQPAAR